MVIPTGRGGGLVVSAPNSRSRGPSLSPGWVICVVFLHGQDT